MKLMRYVFAVCFLIFAPGCSDDDTGRMVVRMVDAPSALESVNIVLTGIEVHQAGSDDNSGWIEISSAPGMYDLLDLRNGISAVIADFTLPAGHYTQVRLHLDSGSNIIMDGESYPLEIPSGIQSGLKLNHQFMIEAGTLYDLTLDFDAAKSVTQTGNGVYMLNPVIRLQATEASGSISGAIDPGEVVATVWTITGTDTVSTLTVDGTGYFKLVALPPGIYTLMIVPPNGEYQTMAIREVPVVQNQDTPVGSWTLLGPR